MFILLNGSFGIGKTATAACLRRELPGSTISDPERVGYVLRRLPAFLLGLQEQPADYQDMALWRRLIVHQARIAHRRARTVIVPMAFTDRTYLVDFAGALAATAPVHKICLVAPLAVVRERLLRRGLAEGRTGLTEFETRRSAECVNAHGDPFFGIPVNADQPTEAITRAIRELLAPGP